MARSRKKTAGSTTESDNSKPDTEDTRTSAEGRDAAAPADVEDAEVVEEIAPGTDKDEKTAAESDAQSPEAESDKPEAASDEAAETDTASSGDPEPGAQSSDEADAKPETDGPETPETDPEGKDEPAKDDPPSPPPFSAGRIEGTDQGPQAASAREEKPAAAPPLAPVPAARPTQGATAILPLVIGGVVAGLIGYGAARFAETRNVDPDAPTPAVNAVAISGQASEIAALRADTETELAALRAVDLSGEIAAETTPLSERISDVTVRLDALAGEMSRLEDRIETIALRPTGTGVEADEFDDALSEFRNQLNAAIANAQSEISEAREEAARISEEAFSAEEAATVRAAWDQVRVALDSGAPYTDALNVVTDVSGVAAPDPLVSSAAGGVPTLAELQRQYSSAARTALEASIRADTGDAPMDRLTSFLRVQSGMRSLTPREGDDPDAILSRMEAALRAGDLETVLAESEGLPDPGREALSEWAAAAQTRLDAVGAATALSEQLNSN